MEGQRIVWRIHQVKRLQQRKGRRIRYALRKTISQNLQRLMGKPSHHVFIKSKTLPFSCLYSCFSGMTSLHDEESRWKGDGCGGFSHFHCSASFSFNSMNSPDVNVTWRGKRNAFIRCNRGSTMWIASLVKWWFCVGNFDLSCMCVLSIRNTINLPLFLRKSILDGG